MLHKLTKLQIGEPVCGITSVAFSVSGRLLFAGYDDFECKVCLIYYIVFHIIPVRIRAISITRTVIRTLAELPDAI